MWYSETTQKSIAVTRGTCPFCHVQASLKFFKQQKYSRFMFVPWWSTKYCVTCGNCFSTFEISKEEMERIDKTAGRNEALGVRRNFCSNCGAQIEGDLKFCGKCGAQLRF